MPCICDDFKFVIKFADSICPKDAIAKAVKSTYRQIAYPTSFYDLLSAMCMFCALRQLFILEYIFVMPIKIYRKYEPVYHFIGRVFGKSDGENFRRLYIFFIDEI